MNERYDVVIVGAGIAGISAAIYLKRSSLSFCLLERGAPGGKLNTIHRIDNYPGLPRISGLEFSISLQKQLSDLGGKVDYGNVVEATKSDGGFALRLDSGKTVYCSSIICASGSSERKIGIPGEKEFFGKGVSYCATCDGAFFRGQDVLVYGYKDFAAEDALYLSSICRKVYFVHPRPLEVVYSHLEELRACPNVEILEGELESLGGDSRLAYAVLADSRKLEVSGAFPLFEQTSGSAFLAPLGVKEEKGFIVVDEDMQSSVEGVYACGDVVSKRLRQLSNAAGEGAIAATAVIARIKGRKG